MKKSLKWLFGLLLFVPFNIWALSGNASISCNPNKVSSGGTSTCSVYYNVTSGALTGFSVDLSGENLTITGGTKGSGWEGDFVASSNKLSVYTGTGKTGKVLIGTINVKVTGSAGGTAKLKASNASTSDEEFADNSISISDASISIANNDTSLKSLTVEGVNVLSSKSYTTDKASVSITASKNVSSQTISGDGYKNLNCGNNSFTISVTAEAGNKSDYTINVKRTCSSDASLKELVVDNGKINFSPSTYTYSVELPADVNSLTATATVNDSLTKIDQRIKTVKLDKGKSSNIVFNLTAQDGTKKTYTIKVTRLDDRSTDNSLKSLEVLDDKSVNLITFGSKTTYNVTVEFEVNEVNVKAVANDSKASIKGKVGKQSLNVGNNKLTVTVTAENGTTKNYIININRKDVSGEVEETEDNDILSSLMVDGFDIDFDSNKFDYEIEIDKDVSELVINASPLKDDRTIEVVGNGNFKEGTNEVNINVIYDNQIVNTYTIRAIIPEEVEEEVIPPVEKKEEEKKNNNLILYVGIGVALLVIIIIVIVLKKKKSNKDNSVNNMSTPVDTITLESHNDDVVQFSDKLDRTQQVNIENINSSVTENVSPVVEVPTPVVSPAVAVQPEVNPVPVVEPVPVSKAPEIELPAIKEETVVNPSVSETPIQNIFPEVELPVINEDNKNN